MPCACCCAAAPIASSSRSPGMNLETERRTKAVRVARSRSQRLVESASNALRAMLITSKKSFDESAVDLNRRSVDIRGRVGQQERADAAEFARVAVAAERHGGERAFLLVL